MKNKFKALDSLHASPELKNKTLDYIYSQPKKKTYNFPFKPVIAFACALILVFGNIFYMNKPVQAYSYMSIDAIPSMEFTLNNNDIVLDVVSYNDDAKNLLQSTQLKGLHYKEALEIIFQKEGMNTSQSVTIAVVCEEEKKEQELLEYISSLKNTKNCYDGDLFQLEAAHECGMSLGKYKYYLEWKELDEQVQAEDCKEMSIQEISEQIDCHNQVSKDNDSSHHETNTSSQEIHHDENPDDYYSEQHVQQNSHHEQNHH